MLQTILQGTRPRFLTDVLRIAQTTCGDQVKIVTSTQRLSYADIALYSDRLAGRLVARDVRPGDRVVISLPNSAEFIIACFAVWKARGVVVALDHCGGAASLQSILERIEPIALIADANFAEKIRGMGVVLRFFRVFFLRNGGTELSAMSQPPVEFLQSAMESDAEAKLPALAQPDDLATITFTSGSTNLPKGVMHTHESILACASFTKSYLQLSPDDVMMLPLPLHHVLAFRRFLTCFLAECTLVLASSNVFMMKQFSETLPTGLVLVPSACKILIDNFADFFRKEGRCLRYVEIGSDPISAERLHALQTILPDARLHLTYGLTEGRVGYLKAGSNGVFDRLDRSNRGVEIKVVDDHGVAVGEGDAGEILISGSGLFNGYWGDSTSARTRCTQDGFRTGDLGIVEKDGIRLAGRMDDIIKIGGHKINPCEIETVLLRHPAVAEAVVTAHMDAEGSFGHDLQALVVRKAGVVVSDIELIDYCREHLELYKVPAIIHFRDSLPKTALGKIQRHLVTQS